MGIPLLTPESVKIDSKSQEREQAARVRDFSMEEERLIKSINDLKVAEQEEKDRVREDVATFRNAAQIEVGKIDLTISSKKKEVEALEARRAEAMKPIEEIRKEADDRNAASKVREDAVTKREADQKLAEEAHVEALEQLHDDRQVLTEDREALDDREERVKQEEERSKESQGGLTTRWVQFHETVGAKDKELTAREAKVTADEQINIIKAQELDKKEAEYKEKDREIASRYEALERAHIAILGNKQHD